MNKEACPSCADHSGKGRGKGKCGRCLKSGCFWVNDDKSCFDVCPANADCASTPPPEKGAKLTCGTSEYTAAQIAAFDPAATDFPNEYIVTTRNQGDNAALLEELAPWTPTQTYTIFPGFAGTMNITQLAGLLADARVDSVECDKLITTDGDTTDGDITAEDHLPFRSLLRFGSEADKMCFDFKIEDKNEMMCRKAGRGKGKPKNRRGCETCLRQKLFVAPGTKPAEKFCKWFPDTGSCSPEGEQGEEYQAICDCKNKKREWPELVGRSAEDAKEAIERVCPKTHEVITILEGSFTTKDSREDRVWIWHYENQTVYQAPKIG